MDATAGRTRRPSALVLILLLAVATAAGCLRREGPVTGPALVPGMRLCVGVPANVCKEQVASLARPGHGALVAYRITCTHRPACTPQEGDATVEALYADGSTESGGFGWAGSQLAP